MKIVTDSTDTSQNGDCDGMFLVWPPISGVARSVMNFSIFPSASKCTQIHQQNADSPMEAPNTHCHSLASMMILKVAATTTIMFAVVPTSHMLMDLPSASQMPSPTEPTTNSMMSTPWHSASVWLVQKRRIEKWVAPLL